MVFSFFFHNPDMPWQCGAAPMCTCSVQSVNTVVQSDLPPRPDDTLVWLPEASIAVFRGG